LMAMKLSGLAAEYELLLVSQVGEHRYFFLLNV
jgi:hypothetical protein